MRLKVGIMGSGGMVGSTMMRWFLERKGYKRGKDLFCYDINPTFGHNDDVNSADITAICVPTRPDKEGRCDSSIVEGAVSKLRKGMVVAVKSTVVPGTTLRLANKFRDKKFLMVPEYLTEKYNWEEFLGVCGRQIVAHTGGETIPWARTFLAHLPMAAFMCPWGTDYTEFEMESTEAEMAKYFANVFGAQTVVFSNIFQDMCHAMEVAFACEGIEGRVDYEKVKECVSADPRIGPSWKNVNYGKYRGYGGFCFPKDVMAFIMFMKDTRTIVCQYAQKHDPVSHKLSMLLGRMTCGIKVLEAAWDYNVSLLLNQGLTIEDVSKHDAELEKKLLKVVDLAPQLIH